MLNAINRKHLIKTDLVINAPQSEVWHVLADFNNVYTWAPSVTHSYGLNEKDQQQGAGRHCDIQGFGSIDEVITQWQESQGFQFTVSELGPLTNAISNWQLEQVSDNKTRISVEFGYDLRFGVFGKVMHGLVMKSKLTSGLNSTLQALKTRVETGKLLRPLNAETAAA